MRAEQAERLVVEMRGKGGARRAALLAPHLRAIGVVNAHRLVGEQSHLFGTEQLGQEQPALAVEIVDLLLGQFHVASSFGFLFSPLMVRSASSRVSNHEASGPILRDAAKWPLLRMRTATPLSPAPSASLPSFVPRSSHAPAPSLPPLLRCPKKYARRWFRVRSRRSGDNPVRPAPWPSSGAYAAIAARSFLDRGIAREQIDGAVKIDVERNQL